MRKLNNKGVTLVELIVSFALVAVAVVYFFQTLYTVKSLYSKSTTETSEFVIKDYGLRLADAYIDSKNDDDKPSSGSNLTVYYDNKTGISESKDNSCANSLDTKLYKFISSNINSYNVRICY